MNPYRNRYRIRIGLLALIAFFICSATATLSAFPLIGIITFLVVIEIYLFSLPAHRPSLQRAAQRNPKWRRILVISLPLLLFITNYVSFFYLEIQVGKFAIFDSCGYVSNSFCSFDNLGVEPDLYDALDRELLLRNALWSEAHCFSSNEEICLAADEIHTFSNLRSLSQWRWSSILFIGIISVIPSLITGFLIWRSTKNPHKQKKAKT